MDRKRNRTVVTRTVYEPFYGSQISLSRFSFLPSIHPSSFSSILPYSFPCFNRYIRHRVPNNPDIRSTLRMPGQKDSVWVKNWRFLRLDIQVGVLYILHPQTVQIALSTQSQSQGPRTSGQTVAAQQSTKAQALNFAGNALGSKFYHPQSSELNPSGYIRYFHHGVAILRVDIYFLL